MDELDYIDDYELLEEPTGYDEADGFYGEEACKHADANAPEWSNGQADGMDLDEALDWWSNHDDASQLVWMCEYNGMSATVTDASEAFHIQTLVTFSDGSEDMLEDTVRAGIEYADDTIRSIAHHSTAHRTDVQMMEHEDGSYYWHLEVENDQGDIVKEGDYADEQEAMDAAADSLEQGRPVKELNNGQVVSASKYASNDDTFLYDYEDDIFTDKQDLMDFLTDQNMAYANGDREHAEQLAYEDAYNAWMYPNPDYVVDADGVHDLDETDMVNMGIATKVNPAQDVREDKATRERVERCMHDEGYFWEWELEY